ncbi:Curved DNA-binding protein [bioreactor metagenome]|uniref:Curved DNA-binding protein n=1 Tax=bioreactor metagenome TaxID=1076179 RepID=A0A644YB04_9ZZZZ
MQGFLDYYRILQVHPMAEPEVIEGAYKRLARKYHPDVSRARDAESRMKQINEAYEVLGDPARRKSFDALVAARQRSAERARPTPPPPPPPPTHQRQEQQEEKRDHPALPMLNQYFRALRDKLYDEAYGLLSSADKGQISPEDFGTWQGAVSKVYRLEQYDCSPGRTDHNRVLGGVSFPQVTEFSVSTVEHNTVMNRKEKDIIVKYAVLEAGGWRVFLGYRDVRPYIAKFEDLSGLLKAKEVVHEMVELYSNRDYVSGLLNKKGMIDEMERELWRCARYGNPFSLMLLELELGAAKGQDLADCAAVWAGVLLQNNCRRPDVVARWADTKFMVLMPETNLSGGLKAALKLREVLTAQRLTYGGKARRVSVSIGVEEFRAPLEQTLGRLNGNLGLARQRRGSAVACANGIYNAD